MPETLMTEAAAWREVAERMDRLSRGDDCGMPRGYCGGLCDVRLHMWHLERAISDDTFTAMGLRVHEHVGHLGFWVRKNAHYGVRCLAALFLALECEDEQRAVAKQRKQGH